MAPEHLDDYGRVLAEQDLLPPRVGQILRPAPRKMARVRRLHKEACRLAESRPKILMHPEVAHALEQDLIHALVVCLTEAKVPAETAAMRHHARLMIQLEDILAEPCNRPPHVREVCKALGVTDRTLRTCCTEFLGISPARYLRLRWLKLVRMALQHADPATTSIAELARRYGFTEPGRFAVAYRMAFGETPSSTLRNGLRTLK
jgi:AraC-like DNA-binding protein